MWQWLKCMIQSIFIFCKKNVCSQLSNFSKLPVALNSIICSLKSETSLKSTVGEKVLCFSRDFPELAHGGVSVWRVGVEWFGKKKAKNAKPLLVSHKAFNSRVSNRLSYEAVTFLSTLNLIFRLKIFTQSF